MPIYEYNCMDCNEFFSILQWSSNQNTECPKCGSKNIKKKLSSFSCSCSIDSSSGSSRGSSNSGFSRGG